MCNNNNNDNDNDDDNMVIVTTNNNKFLVPLEEIFDTVHSAHISCGHGGEKRTNYELKNQRNIANITMEQIKLFISLCEICNKKRNILKKKSKNNNSSSSSNIIISSNFGERGQVDLIDLSMYSTSEGYKYILNYQDHLTKFVILRPLKSKNATEVNEVLLDIFTTLGAPEILQCDNGKEFSRIRVDLLDRYWPSCKLVHGRPRHPQSQGSIERANGDVMNMLRGWLSENSNGNGSNSNSSSSSSWANQLNFVQLQKNNSFNRTIKCSPFKAVFGREMPVSFNAATTTNNNDEDDDIDDDDDDINNDVNDNDNDNIDGINDDDDDDDNVIDDDDDDDDMMIYESENENNSISNSNNSNNNNNDISSVSTTTTSSSSSSVVTIYNKNNNNNNNNNEFCLPEKSNIVNNKRKRNDSFCYCGSSNDSDNENDSSTSSENVNNNIEIVKNMRKKVSQQLLKSGSCSGSDTNKNEKINIGTPVLLKIPKIDSHKLGFPNTIGIIHKYIPDVDKYEIKTKHGIINRLFSKTNFEICLNLNVNIEEEEEDEKKKLSLRQVAKLDCVNFVGCRCYGRCQNNKCFCYKHKKLCGNLCTHLRLADDCFNKVFKKTVHTRTRKF